MNLISFDISKKQSGVYSLTNGLENFGVINTEHTKTDSRALLYFYDRAKIILDYEKPGISLIEGYSYGSQKITVEAEFVGIAKALLTERGIPYIIIPPMVWKANTIGNIKKTEERTSKKTGKKYQAKTADSIRAYLNAVYAHCQIQFEDTDTADAYLMYIAFKNILKKTAYLTPAEKKIKDQYIKIRGTHGKD